MALSAKNSVVEMGFDEVKVKCVFLTDRREG